MTFFRRIVALGGLTTVIDTNTRHMQKNVTYSYTPTVRHMLEQVLTKYTLFHNYYGRIYPNKI